MSRYEQDTLPSLDESLDELTHDYYLKKLEKIDVIEKGMAGVLFRDAQYLVTEHTTPHAEATKQAAAVRPYLAKRGLIEEL